MPSALDQLIAYPPKEFAGSRASNRFAYQRDWTFCLLLTLHVAESDYLIVCDYHDDVLVLDHGDSPRWIDFYQIKTDATKRWTTTRMLSRPQGKSSPLPSVIGKLYGHRRDFPLETRALHLVSNLPFSVVLRATSADTRDSFTAVELSDEELSALRLGLQKELSLDEEPLLDAGLVFRVSDLSLLDHAANTKGRLVDYLEARDPSRQFPVTALYRAIADEIERKTNIERPMASVVDLLRFKGITRGAFEKILSDCLTEADQHDPRRIGQTLSTDLASEGVPFGERDRICRALARFGIERLDRARADLSKWSAHARSYCASALPKHVGTLIDFLRLGTRTLKAQGAGRALTDDYITAIVAWEVLTTRPVTSTEVVKRQPTQAP